MPLPQNNLAYTSPSYPSMQHYAGDAKFSWATEYRHLFSSRSFYIFGWPFFQFRQRRFNQSPLFRTCRPLPGFSDLWQTILKGSFAYNSLFLGLNPVRSSADTGLADITTLALFFGDEFIDGIAFTAGKPFIRQLILDKPGCFYLCKITGPGTIRLQYCFDLRNLLTEEVMLQVNPKYQVTYQRFHSILESFLELMNEQLAKLPLHMREKAADKIAEGCNTCFDSFLHDVNNCPSAGLVAGPADVLHFHELKTAYMQTRLLELRCIVANKEEAMTSIQAPGWVDIMRVIQVYDDIQDIIIDEGLQDNLLISVAAHYFPEEWNWFAENKQLVGVQQPLLLSLYMPGTMQYCLQMASDKIRCMNWEQQKIVHYLIFKKKYSLYINRADNGAIVQKDFLKEFYRRVKDKMPHLSLSSVKAFAVDTCIHLPGIRKQLLRKLDLSTAYQLRYNLLSVSVETKAALFDKVY